MITLYIDLETAPTQDAKAKAAIFARPEFAELPFNADDIQPAANLKDPEKIAASIKERTVAANLKILAENGKRFADADKAWRDTALDGWAGHIMMIGHAINNHIVYVENAFTTAVDGPEGGRLVLGVGHPYQETNAIKWLFHSVEAAIKEDAAAGGDGEVVIVGHNIRRFDILFLWQRCVVLRIKPPNWLLLARADNKYRPEYVLDTMELCGTTTGKPFGPGLNRVCAALGITGKGDIDGSKVYDAIMSGRYDEAAEYCGDDVRRVRTLARRIRGEEPLDVDVMFMKLPVPAAEAPAPSVAA